MKVNELIELLKKQDPSLKVESSQDTRQLLFLLNKNQSCQCTIDLKWSDKK